MNSFPSTLPNFPIRIPKLIAETLTFTKHWDYFGDGILIGKFPIYESR